VRLANEVLADNVEVQVAPPGLAQQKLPSLETMAVEIDVPLRLALAPLTDAQGHRFYYEPDDVTATIDGPEADWGISKSKDELVLQITPKQPGTFSLQLFVFALPVFPAPVRFTARGQAAEIDVAPNPVAGRQNIMSLEGLVDVRGRPLHKIEAPTLMLKAARADGKSFEGRGIVTRFGDTAMTFAPAKDGDGYYEANIYENEAQLLSHPLKLYVGTSDLLQQSVVRRHLNLPQDGAEFFLQPLTDHTGRPLPVKDGDLRLVMTALQGGHPIHDGGHVRLESTGALMVTVRAPPGQYEAQVEYKGRPILIKPMSFTVES